MDLKTINYLIKTRTFKILIIGAIFYFSGFLIFKLLVEPFPELIQTGGINFWRDIIYVIYWRYSLDWLIIFGMIGAFFLLAAILSFLKRKYSSKKDALITYVLPILLMTANAVGMIAIDLAVTVFADIYINGTWESPTIYLFGMKAQQIYHQFFFWFMPFLLINGFPLLILLHQEYNIYLKPLKTLFIMMACYSFTLGLIDPFVCQIIWNDWSIFGDWNMLDQGGIFAAGWILHYIILGSLWLTAAFLTQKAFSELNHRT